MAHLLVIDDDSAVRDVIRLYLEGSGHSVIEAKDGFAGVKAFTQASFDLVITDIFMPDQDGIETIRMLRKLRPTIKIIAISGGIVGDRVYLREAKALGADCVLPKPFRRKDPTQSRRRVPRCGALLAMMRAGRHPIQHRHRVEPTFVVMHRQKRRMRQAQS